MVFFPRPPINRNELDLAMRTSLANSIEYVYSAAKNQLDCASSELTATLSEILAHRVKPGLFGRYYRLVLAFRRDRRGEARDLFGEIIQLSQERPVFRIVPFSDQALGSEKSLYAALIDPTPAGSPLFTTPDTEQWNSFDKKVMAALAIVDKADEALAQEIKSLIVDVVGAVPSRDDHARQFGSASSFMLWGALVINVDRYRTAYALVEALVHESAHQLLFAHSIDHPLVLNPIEERYPSPLRTDPRPMDGVYHATFVTARVFYVLRRIQEAALCHFASIDGAVLDQKLEALRARFAGGLETVRRFGRLSQTGARILEEASEYMRAA